MHDGGWAKSEMVVGSCIKAVDGKTFRRVQATETALIGFGGQSVSMQGALSRRGRLRDLG